MRQIVITVGRRYGSGGHEIGQKLAERLGIPFYDRELVELAAEKSGIDEGILAIYNERKGNSSLLKTKSGTGNRPLGDLLFQTQSQIIQELADRGSCVIIGRCAEYLLKGTEGLLRVYVYADMDYRIRRITRLGYYEPDEVAKNIRRMDKERREYHRYYTGLDWENLNNYDLLVNTGTLGIDGAVRVIRDCLAGREG